MITVEKNANIVSYLKNFRDFYSVSEGKFHVNCPEQDGLKIRRETPADHNKDVLTCNKGGHLYVYIAQNT